MREDSTMRAHKGVTGRKEDGKGVALQNSEVKLKAP